MPRMDCLRLIVLVVLSALLVSCGKNPEAAKRSHLASGNRFFDARKYNEAVIEYRKAIQIDPKFGEARLKLARAYTELNDLENAIREYVRAADLLPDDLELQLTTGQLLLMARRFDDAKTKAELVLARQPANANAHILKGNAIAGLKDVDAAVKEVQEAIQLDPDAAHAYVSLGSLLVTKQDLAAAEASFLKAVELAPESANARLALASFYWSTGRPALAEAPLKAALGIDSRNVLANRAMALYYMAVGRAAEAEPFLKVLADRPDDPGARFELADYYARVKRFADAVALLDKMATVPQTAAAARVRIAAIYHAQGKDAEAHKALDEVLARAPNHAMALLVKGRLLSLEGKTDEAVVRLRAAVASEPGFAPARYALALVYLSRNNLEEAAREFRETIRLSPRAVGAQFELARIALVAGSAEDAVRYAEAAAAALPGSLDAQLTFLRALLRQGDLPRAAAVLKPLLSKASASAAVQAMHGVLLARQNQQAAARQSFEKALAIDPKLTEAVAGLVELDLAANRPGAATVRVESHLAARPSDPAVMLLAGRTYARAGNPQRAEELLRQAISIAPGALEAYQLLARVYYDQHRLGDATAELERAAQRQPRSVAAHTMVAVLLEAQGKLAEAQKRYQLVLELDPRAAVAANNLAWIYASRGENLDVALQLAQTAKAQLPDQPDVNDTLGWIYYLKDQAALALPLLEAAVEKNPTNPVHHYHLGMAAVQVGDWARGRRALEQALKLGENFEGAAEARRTLAGLPK